LRQGGRCKTLWRESVSREEERKKEEEELIPNNQVLRRREEESEVIYTAVRGREKE